MIPTDPEFTLLWIAGIISAVLLYLFVFRGMFKGEEKKRYPTYPQDILSAVGITLQSEKVRKKCQHFGRRNFTENTRLKNIQGNTVATVCTQCGETLNKVFNKH